MKNVWENLKQIQSTKGTIEDLGVVIRLVSPFRKNILLDEGKKQAEYLELFMIYSDETVSITSRIVVDLEKEEPGTTMLVRIVRQSRKEDDPLRIVRLDENTKIALIFVSDSQIKQWRKKSTD